MIKLDARLNAVLNEIDGHTLVDVGCDHGKIACKALIDKKVEKVIATDISTSSLKKAKLLAQKYRLENIEFRVGDGLSVIKDNEVDVAVIAGMGGFEIIKILKNKPIGINKYILVAHTNVKELREYLVSDEKIIEKDYVIYCDKHYYNIIVCKNGHSKITKKELFLGKNFLNNKDYYSYLFYLKDKYEKILLRKIPTNKEIEIKDILSLIEDEIDEG